MDLHQQDIREFLREWLPLRFNQLSPQDFENFVRYLFEVDEYELLPSEAAGEFAGFVYVKKDGISLLLLPWQLPENQEAGGHVIEKMIRARDFYDPDDAWVITNGVFSNEARSLADASEIELWDWDSLYEALCQMFFEGKTHTEYYQAHPLSGVSKEQQTDLKLKVKWQPVEGVGTEWYNLGITITNPTDRNVYLHLELPALIDLSKNQVMAEQWVEGEFVAGLIYAGASIRTNVLFSAARLGDRPPGGRIMLTCHERLDVPVTYHLQARLQGQACYIVTYCYGINSPEYLVLTQFRDHVLARTLPGQLLISSYYFISPWLIRIATLFRLPDLLLRGTVHSLMPLVMMMARRAQDHYKAK